MTGPSGMGGLRDGSAKCLCNGFCNWPTCSCQLCKWPWGCKYTDHSSSLSPTQILQMHWGSRHLFLPSLKGQRSLTPVAYSDGAWVSPHHMESSPLCLPGFPQAQVPLLSCWSQGTHWTVRLPTPKPLKHLHMPHPGPCNRHLCPAAHREDWTWTATHPLTTYQAPQTPVCYPPSPTHLHEGAESGISGVVCDEEAHVTVAHLHRGRPVHPRHASQRQRAGWEAAAERTWDTARGAPWSLRKLSRAIP